MKPSDVYEALGLPIACTLGKRVFKKLFHQNARLAPADTRALSEDVNAIVWQLTLRPDALPIQPYTDEEREYLEIAVLEVALLSPKRAARLVEIIHRAIPYPLLIVLSHKESVSLSVAHKRFSLAEKGAVVAEDFLLTPWIEGEERSLQASDFLSSLNLRGLPQANFLTLYAAMVERLLAFMCAEVSGRFVLKPEEPESQRRARLERCRSLEQQIVEMRDAIHHETQFAIQVDLNTRLKETERRLAEEAAVL